MALTALQDYVCTQAYLTPQHTRTWEKRLHGCAGSAEPLAACGCIISMKISCVDPQALLLSVIYVGEYFFLSDLSCLLMVSCPVGQLSVGELSSTNFEFPNFS